MELLFKNAQLKDAQVLIDVYNSAFYDDYIRYGQCPAYGRTIERMENSIKEFPKIIFYIGDKAVGVISYKETEGKFYIGTLCVIPEFQGQGIGTAGFRYFLSRIKEYKEISLITPSDKIQNIKFYTEKCGFTLGQTMKDGNVEVVNLYIK